MLFEIYNKAPACTVTWGVWIDSFLIALDSPLSAIVPLSGHLRESTLAYKPVQIG